MSDLATEPSRTRRRRSGILIKLVVAFAVPTALLFGGFAVIAHQAAKSELETELGKRLTAVASAAAGLIRDPLYLAGLGPDDEEDIAYRRARRDLSAMARDTGVTRLYLFDAEYRSIADSGEGVPLGSVYFQAELDRVELGRMFEDGKPKSSVLFEGKDGRLYKAAYAPVKNEAGVVILAVGVDAPAEFFARLEPLRRTLFLIGAALVVVMVVVATLLARRIAQPIHDLAEAAERIGRGNLERPVDVTARDELRVLAETMDRMRADLMARDQRNQMMLAGIAHEVRNPLGGIELFAGILRDEIEEGDERREHVERIVRELDYLKRVVESFLEYARRPAPSMEDLDLAEVGKEVVAVESADAVQAEVELVSELQPAAMRGDRDQLRRAVLNLVRNAIQASAGDSDAREVTIRSGTRAGRAFLEVHNRGEALSDHVKEQMFQPFYTSKEKGTGLGLAFVKEIVDDHDGDIVVDSTAESGTRFEVRFAAR
jgi:signal transduction histidine kinase